MRRDSYRSNLPVSSRRLALTVRVATTYSRTNEANRGNRQNQAAPVTVSVYRVPVTLSTPGLYYR